MLPCARCRNLFTPDALWPCMVCEEMVCASCLYETHVNFAVFGHPVENFPMYVCSAHLRQQPEPEVTQ